MVKSLIIVLKNIFKPILFIIGIALVIALVVSWIAAIISLFFGQTYLAYLFPDQLGLATGSLGSLFLMVGLPLVSILFFISRFTFGTRVRPFWRRTVLVATGLSWIFFFSSVSYLSRNFQEKRNAETLSTTVINTDVLDISIEDNSEYKDKEDLFSIEMNGSFQFFKGADELVVANTELHFRKSEDTEIKVKQVVYSFGKDGNESKQLSENLDYQVQFQGDKLIIPKYFFIKKGEKFRGQNIHVYIDMPQGKSIKVNDDIKHLIDEFDSPDYNNDEYWECNLWTMTDEGLKCSKDLKEKIKKIEEEKINIKEEI